MEEALFDNRFIGIKTKYSPYLTSANETEPKDLTFHISKEFTETPVESLEPMALKNFQNGQVHRGKYIILNYVTKPDQ